VAGNGVPQHNRPWLTTFGGLAETSGRWVGLSGRFPCAARMTAAGQFIADLHKERRSGKVSSGTELHLKPRVPKAWLGYASQLAAAVGEEIDRLER
jgi:hypothetical protein